VAVLKSKLFALIYCSLHLACEARDLQNEAINMSNLKKKERKKATTRVISLLYNSVEYQNGQTENKINISDINSFAELRVGRSAQ
jgi:hypothetical protein